MNFNSQSVQWTSFADWTLSGLQVKAGALTLADSWFSSYQVSPENGYGDGLGGYGAGTGYTAQVLALQQAKAPLVFANPFKDMGGYASGAFGYGAGSGEYASAALNQFAEGIGESPDYALNAVPMVWLGQVWWNATIPPATVFNLSISYDQGKTWRAPVNGCWWPGMIQNAPLLAQTIRFRVVMSTRTIEALPALQQCGAYVVERTLGVASAAPLPYSVNPVPAKTLPDFVALMQSLLPKSWFTRPAPVLTGVLTGVAYPLWAVYQQIAALKTQARLQTASGEMLDIAAYDFHGVNFARVENETDTSFSARLRRSLFQPSATRGAVIAAVEGVTNRQATIIEPTNPQDTGGYGYAAGYSSGGRFGSLLHPYTFLVDALRPLNNNLPALPGYGSGPLAYNVPSGGAYFDIGLSNLGTDSLIFDAILAAKAAGVEAFVRVQSAPQQRGPFVQ